MSELDLAEPPNRLMSGPSGCLSVFRSLADVRQCSHSSDSYCSAALPALESFEKSLFILRNLDLDPNEYCIAGSAALYLLSRVAVVRGYLPLIDRIPNDIDVLAVGSAFDKASRHGSYRTRTLSGVGACVDISVDGAVIEVTNCWPSHSTIQSRADLMKASHDIGGVRVMDLSLVAELKTRMAREKDIQDHRVIDRAFAQAAPGVA